MSSVYRECASLILCKKFVRRVVCTEFKIRFRYRVCESMFCTESVRVGFCVSRVCLMRFVYRECVMRELICDQLFQQMSS